MEGLQALLALISHAHWTISPRLTRLRLWGPSGWASGTAFGVWRLEMPSPSNGLQLQIAGEQTLFRRLPAPQVRHDRTTVS